MQRVRDGHGALWRAAVPPLRIGGAVNQEWTSSSRASFLVRDECPCAAGVARRDAQPLHPECRYRPEPRSALAFAGARSVSARPRRAVRPPRPLRRKLRVSSPLSKALGRLPARTVLKPARGEAEQPLRSGLWLNFALQSTKLASRGNRQRQRHSFVAFSFLPPAVRAPRDGARSSIDSIDLKPSSVFCSTSSAAGPPLPAEPVPDGRFATFCVLPRAVASRPLFWPPFPTTHGRARAPEHRTTASGAAVESRLVFSLTQLEDHGGRRHQLLPGVPDRGAGKPNPASFCVLTSAPRSAFRSASDQRRAGCWSRSAPQARLGRRHRARPPRS